ncbi:hypothetical protein AYX14_07130 [Cryptococcus neoformans]|nr:hypothetical protein AYX14_07130 [Cryptococcus neoformans var. grubii]
MPSEQKISTYDGLAKAMRGSVFEVEFLSLLLSLSPSLLVSFSPCLLLSLSPSLLFLSPPF